MPQNRIAWLIAMIAGLSCTWAHAGPKPRADRRDAEPDEVKLVLQREQHAPLDRRAELQRVLKRQPDLATARWQSGYMQAGKAWRSYSSPADPMLLELLEQYRERRTALDGTVRAHLALARWCRQQGLLDEELAHRFAALSIAKSAEQRPILESLGYRVVGGQWVSAEEFSEWHGNARRAVDSLRVWGHEVERIAGLLRGSTREREKARQTLVQIQDPRAIPALEAFLAHQDVSDASLLVKTLAGMRAFEATSTLMRLAVFSEFPEIRRQAAQALRGRNLDDFVPPLIELICTPVTMEERVEFKPARGTLFYSYLIRQETHDEIRLQSSLLFDYGGPPLTIGLALGEVRTEVDIKPTQELLASAWVTGERAFWDGVHSRRISTDRLNGKIDEINARLISVLAAVSGEETRKDPREWWAWWAMHSDVERGSKRVITEEAVTMARPIVVDYFSCFARGTSVWSETGPIPIENLQVGDRVLSQNVETGELAFKPVLRTTVRPAKQLLRLSSGGDSIVCTGGHRFWVAGEAWIKARELAPKKLLHTATASIPVESISEGPKAETHNLVVADFHSYFVGQQAFLVQDLPLPRSTNCVVPGLQPEW